MLLFKHLSRRLTDLQKVQYLLRHNAEINDAIGVKRYDIYFVHQRIADLRRMGWVIESVNTVDKDGNSHLKTYKLISESLFAPAK